MKKLLNKDLLKLIDELHEHGAICYVVGGFVRDFLLERAAYDIDIEIHNIDVKLFETIIERYGEYKLQGKFGVYKILNFDNVEFAIPRIESVTGVKHTDFSINLDPYMGTKQASLRRDFTVNALMYDLKSLTIIDHYQGINDLNNKVLRHVSPKFSEDPLRVLRGIRFASELGFKIAEDTLRLAQTIPLDNIATERMNNEFRRYFLGEYLYDTLDDFKYLFGHRYYFNELDLVPQNPIYHPEGNAWLHTKEAVKVGIEVFKNESDDIRIIGLTSLLFHDIGKVCKLTKEKITHEELSSRYFLKFANEITGKKSDIKLINNCILFHMQPRNIDKMTAEEILLILKTFKSDLPIFLKVTTADICCRYASYQEAQVALSISVYQQDIVNRFIDLDKYYQTLKVKYNGQYFIDKKITGHQIGQHQNELYTQLINTYNRKWT